VRKPAIYSGGRRLRKILRWSVPALLLLAAALLALLFLLRSWTVYDTDGAHIVPPWSDLREE